jgi:hypothetical protein
MEHVAMFALSASSLGSPTLDDAKAVFERFLVVINRALPAELGVQPIRFAAANFRPLKDYSKFK